MELQRIGSQRSQAWERVATYDEILGWLSSAISIHRQNTLQNGCAAVVRIRALNIGTPRHLSLPLTKENERAIVYVILLWESHF